MNADPWLPRIREMIYPIAAFAAVATLTFDVSWPVWTAGAEWVWWGYQSALISLSEIGLVLLALIGWLNPRGSSIDTDVESGRSLVTVAGAVLIGLVGLSALGAVMPILSIARLGDICLGWLACLAIARQRRLRDWLIVAGLALVVVQLPLVIAQQVTQSTFPLQGLTLSGVAGISAGDPGAFVVQLPNGTRWQRSLGSFPHPNVLGGFVSTMIVLALPLWRQSARVRWYALLAWLVAWIELVLSFSRSAAIAASIGCVIWVIAEVSSSRRTMITFPLAVALTVLVVLALGSRVLVGDRSSPVGGTAVSERWLLVRVAGDMLRQHPLTGVGAGNFSVVESLPPYDGVMVDPVHAVPLLVAAEAGLPAAMAWMVIVIGPVVAQLKSRAHSTVTVFHPIAVSATLLVLGSFDHYFWTLPSGQSLFWIAIGAGITQ